MEQRSSPLLSQLILWIIFAALVVVSIFTVLIPSISSGDDADEDESAQAD